MKERIQKILANAGVDSRRNVEQMVREGRIAVNNKIIRDLPILVDAQKDRIAVDGEAIRLGKKRGEPYAGERIYILMNKPKGVYSTNVSQGVQKRAIDLLPADFPRVYPVGRLDADTKGLLLLTNDGELTNKLTHPRFGVTKTYRATVDGYVTPETIEKLERGVWVSDPGGGKGSKTPPIHLRIVHRDREHTVFDLTLREGRNFQIRRLFASMGHKLRELVRLKLGPLSIERLAPGKFRLLSSQEIRALREFASGRKEKR